MIDYDRQLNPGFVAEHIETLKNCDIPDGYKENVKHLIENSMNDDEQVKAVFEALEVIFVTKEDEKDRADDAEAE